MSYYIHHEPLMLEDIYAKVLEGLQLQEVNLGNCFHSKPFSIFFYAFSDGSGCKAYVTNFLIGISSSDHRTLSNVSLVIKGDFLVKKHFISSILQAISFRKGFTLILAFGLARSSAIHSK